MNGFKMIGVACMLLTLLCACGDKRQSAATGGQQAAAPEQKEFAQVSRIEGVSLESVQKEAKLVAGYENILMNPVQTGSTIGTDYPEAATQFQTSALAQLLGKKGYKRVEQKQAQEVAVKGKTLVVDAKIIDMRVVGTGARFWGGPFAGSSFIEVYLKLTDAATHKVIHEKVLSTHNNAWGASYALGSEQSLPKDMGIIVGEYVATVVPAK